MTSFRRHLAAGAVCTGLVSSFLVAPVASFGGLVGGPVSPQITRQPLALAAADVPNGQPSATDAAIEESAPIELGDNVLIGVTWDEGADVEASDILVRTSAEGRWSGWEAMPALEEGPDAGTEEAARATTAATASYAVPEGADDVQFRVQAPTAGSATSQASADVDAAGLDLVMVDPGESSAVSVEPLATADAATAAPYVYSRAQWGADESLRNCGPDYNDTVKAAVVHHTAGPNSYSTQAAAMAQIRADYAYHTNALGWCDLGYNFVVDKWGNMYEGRFGGIQNPVLGAHAGGFNRDTTGIAMLGDFSTVTPPAAMTAAVAQIIGWKLSLHGANPWGQTTLTSAGGGTSKYPEGQSVVLPVVMGHRDVGSTACPGNAGYATLNSIRNQASERIDNGAFLRAMYRDVLGRDPDSAGFATWTSILGTNPSARPSAVSGFGGADEYLRLSIDRAYRDVLDRGVDQGGSDGWFADIRAGRATLDDLRPRLLQSREIFLQGGGTNEGYVNRLYQASLGRSAAPAEQTYWAERIRAVGLPAVVYQIWGSREAGLIRVNTLYNTYLFRGAGDSERAYWVDQVMRSGDESLRASLQVSQEYVLKAKSRFP